MVLEKRDEGGDKLTDPNIPASPDSGEIRYFDSIQPALKQGDYEINLSQDFRERGEEGADDTTLMSKQFAKQFFTVEGSQWSIDPLTVHARYPQKINRVCFSTTHFENVFQNKSLPWERSITTHQTCIRRG